MTFEELMINLFQAIKINNLDETKKYVNLINNLKGYDEKKQDLPIFLEIPRLTTDALNNQCYDYILLNLDMGNQDDVRWKRDINILIMNGDKTLIESFIINQLNKKTYNIITDEFEWGLLKLTRELQDPIKINNYLQILDNQKE